MRYEPIAVVEAPFCGVAQFEVFGGDFFRPRRSLEGDGSAAVLGGEHYGAAQEFALFVGVGERLPVFFGAFPARHELRARLHREPRIARAVYVNFRLDAVDFKGFVAARVGCGYSAPLGVGGVDGSVEQQSEIGFGDALVVEEQVPHLPRALRVVGGVVEFYFLDDSGLAPAPFVAVHPERVHFYLATRISPEPRPVLDEDGLRPVAGGGESRANSSEAAARYHDIAPELLFGHVRLRGEVEKFPPRLGLYFAPEGAFCRAVRARLGDADRESIPQERHRRRPQKFPAPEGAIIAAGFHGRHFPRLSGAGQH